jgi:hypothetical protein
MTIKELFWGVSSLEVNYITKQNHWLNMARMGKYLTLFCIIIFVFSSLLPIKPACAQTGVTQPVIPRFDVSLDSYTDYIPPTYGVDPATGKAVITKECYGELHNWVYVRTWGQPFWEYNNSEGYRVLLYYNVRWNSNLDNAWQSLPSDQKYFHDSMDPWDTYSEGYLIPIGFRGIKGAGLQLLDPNAVEIGFQVEALVGYYNSNNVFVGQSSGWSETQTLALSNTLNSATATPSPTIPEFPITILLVTVLAAVSLLLIVGKKKLTVEHML